MSDDPLDLLDDEDEGEPAGGASLSLDEQVPPGRGDPGPTSGGGKLIWTHAQTREMGRLGGRRKQENITKARELLEGLGLDPDDYSLKLLARQVASDKPGATSAHKLLRQVAGKDGARSEAGDTFVVQLDQRSAGQLIAALTQPASKVDVLRITGEQVVRIDHDGGSLWIDAQGAARIEPLL